MSYILDALKRAERDRHLTHVPTLATVHAFAHPTRPRWLWVGGGGLLVSAIVVMLLLRAGPIAGPTGTTSLAPPAAAPPTADVQKSAQPTATGTASSAAPRSTQERSAQSTAPSPTPPLSHATPQTPFAALKLEMVVNADAPGERAVYISGRRYVTGQSLELGATIESIAPDAVVLRFAGQRYLLRWEHPPTPLGR
jgi:general secretion pathway protein B